MLPKDPYILLSYVNTQLRDKGIDPEDFAREQDIDLPELLQKLSSAGFCYDPVSGQFR